MSYNPILMLYFLGTLVYVDVMFQKSKLTSTKNAKIVLNNWIKPDWFKGKRVFHTTSMRYEEKLQYYPKIFLNVSPFSLALTGN